MQRGEIDLCLVGTDRTTANGDVANKIGTYLKALAARDNGVPFYVALPCSSIDWSIGDGLRDIPIEERSPRELTHDRDLHAVRRGQRIELQPIGMARGPLSRDRKARQVCHVRDPALYAVYNRLQ